MQAFGGGRSRGELGEEKLDHDQSPEPASPSTSVTSFEMIVEAKTEPTATTKTKSNRSVWRATLARHAKHREQRCESYNRQRHSSTDVVPTLEKNGGCGIDA